MIIRENVELDYQDVLLLPQRSKLSSRSEVDLNRTYNTPYGKMHFCGVLAANMYSTGSLEMGKALDRHQMGIAYHKFIKTDSANVVKNSFFSIGMKDRDFALLEDYANISYKSLNICIDVANGYQESFIDFVKEVRKRYPEAFIMAGNVVTESVTEQLILAGANVVKVGIGPGSLCKSRMIAGIGRPQFTTVCSCAAAAHHLGGYVCADGGITCVGDICKAFGGGADFVMVGGLFMGYEENDGEWKPQWDTLGRLQPKGQIQCFGMSSKEAQDQFNGGLTDYRASEGECRWISNKGPVSELCKEIRGGLASCCTYIGAKSLKDLPKCAEFVRVNRIK
jgi:GMP reductase